MAVKFTPTGSLDLSTDPSDLGGQMAHKGETSGEMARCTNLDLSRPGMARTRRGITQLSSTAVPGTAHLVEHAGDRYEFTATGIFRNEASIESGLSGGADWSTVKYNAYNSDTESVFATNGTEKKRIDAGSVYRWGIAAPTAAPEVGTKINWMWTHAAAESFLDTTPAAQLGSLWNSTYVRLYDWEEDHLAGDQVGPDSVTERGMYWFESNGIGEDIRAVYTYARYSGTTLEAESAPSPATEVVHPGSALYLRPVASSDSQVTHIRVYRTLNGGTSYLFAGEYDADETKLNPSRPAVSLGVAAPDGHDVLPSNVVDLAGPDFNGVLFAAVGNKVYWSKAKQPEYWPTDYYVEIGPPQRPIKALEMHNGTVYAVTSSGFVQIQGTGSNSFFPVPLSSIAGTLSKTATLQVPGSGIYHLSVDGLHRFTGSGDVRADRRILPILEGVTRGSVPGMERGAARNTVFLAWDGKLYVFYPSLNRTYTRHVLVADLESGQLSHYDYELSIRCLTVDRTADRIIAADNYGNIWHLEDLDASQAAIEWQVQSKDFTDSTRRHFPRWARWDVDGTATGSILLDDVVHQTHAITSRNPKKRHIAPGNGHRISMRVAGTGAATIYQTEVD